MLRASHLTSALLVAALLSGCGGQREQGVQRLEAGPTAPPESVADNLEARVRHRWSRFERGVATDAGLGLLAVELITRAQYLGVVGDLDRARSVAEALVRRQPRKAQSHLLLARVQSSLHRWDDLASSLDKAKALGADVAETSALEATLALARGELGAALRLREALADKRPTSLNTANFAIVRAQAGDLHGALKLFERARERYADTSPLPLVWIWFQHGLALERAGQHGRALELYQRAWQRFPAYAPLAGHLAGALAREREIDRALEILMPVMRRSDDPHYLAIASRLWRMKGNDGASKALATLAAARYQALVRAHGEAFTGHAIDFFLGAGGDPQRAWNLARSTMALNTLDRERLLAAARASGQEQGVLCDVADDMRTQSGSHSMRLRRERARAYRGCGRPVEALLANRLSWLTN